MNFNEEALEEMIIEDLNRQGYDYQPGEEIERDYHDVLLLSHLENSLSRLNPNLQEKHNLRGDSQNQESRPE